MKYAWALMAVLLMSGCASMTREQCQSVDPQAQGYADGQKGLTTRSVDQLLSTCQSGKRAGSISDVSRFKNDYLKAYQKGLAEYCTPGPTGWLKKIMSASLRTRWSPPSNSADVSSATGDSTRTAYRVPANGAFCPRDS